MDGYDDGYGTQQQQQQQPYPQYRRVLIDSSGRVIADDSQPMRIRYADRPTAQVRTTHNEVLFVLLGVSIRRAILLQHFCPSVRPPRCEHVRGFTNVIRRISLHLVTYLLTYVLHFFRKISE